MNRQYVNTNSEIANVEQSIRDLVRIYRPADPEKFAREYIAKYGIPRGHERRVREVVADAIAKLELSL
jgi:hypothetical protein